MKDTLSMNRKPPRSPPDDNIDELIEQLPKLPTTVKVPQGSDHFVDQVDENMATVLDPKGEARLMSVLDLPKGAAEGSNVDPHDIYQGDEADNPRLKELINMLYAVHK